ncbi:MAG: hypothetical protein GY847_00255 [Proteobacteria bacterium]|nr:hypothetical protein [Pseudomonadota bacterium]
MPSLSLSTDKFKNVATELSMEVGTPYRYQNTGPGEITIVFADDEPDPGHTSFIYPTREPVSSLSIIYDGTQGIWARALGVPGKITIEGEI